MGQLLVSATKTNQICVDMFNDVGWSIKDRVWGGEEVTSELKPERAKRI